MASFVAYVVASRIGIKMQKYMTEHKVNPMKNVIGPMSQVHASFNVYVVMVLCSNAVEYRFCQTYI